MLDAFRRLQLSGPPTPVETVSPRLESLEDRAVPAVISGTVYADLNNNGLLDPGEKGLQGSALKLVDSAGNTVATTTSDANGQYQFSQRDPSTLVPATQEVDAVFASSPTNASSTATINQFDPTLGTLTSIDVIAEGSLQSHVQIENLGPAAPVASDLSGTLTFQAPGAAPFSSSPATHLTAFLPALGGQANQAPFTGSSSKDFGTTTLAGTFTEQTITDPTQLAAYTGGGTMTISESATADTCTCGAGNILAMISTTAQGKVKVIYHYTPSNVIGPGSYTIVQTTEPPGYIDGQDTAGNVAPIPGSEKTDTIPVTVNTPTDVIPNNNFGELPPASLAGNVYVDVKGAGAPVPGDPPIQGVAINLTGTDAFGNAVNQTATTDANGAYLFNNLLAGNYTLTETQPNGYLQGTTSFGSLGGAVAGDTISSIPVAAGAQGVNYNFGELQPPPAPAPDVTLPPPSAVPPPSAGTPPAVFTPSPITSVDASKYFFFGASLGSFGWF
jgi:hypothetical protein